jgi:hypothetical protein
MRFLLRGFLLCRVLLLSLASLSNWLFLAAAPASAQTTLASTTPPDMVFYVAKGGPHACGHDCDQWIVADGVFDTRAAQRLRLLLWKLAGRKLPVFFNSPGGNTSGALELGRLLRSERLVAGIGRTTPDGCDRNKLYDEACKALKRDGVAAELDDTTAQCHSACVYALAGAAVRLVPPGARLGIHTAAVRPRVPVEAIVIAEAKAQADRRIDVYLQEMGMDRALFAAANAIPNQSLRFLQRYEIIRFGLDRRQFGETSWHYVERPRPAITKAYFVRTGHQQLAGPQGIPYRNAFLRMSCGDANLMPLTVGIEMARDEEGIGSRSLTIAVNGAPVENGWRPEFPIRSDPTRFDLRTTNVMADRMAEVDDGGSIEILAPFPKGGPQSTVRLTMDGFSEAYARLRKTCDAARSVNASCPLAGAPPHCVTDPPPNQTAQPQPNQ